jgi:sugar O-acyltransferase (sialic acid O-acetyltransferase NeuD family)
MDFVIVGAGGHASDTLEVALRAGWRCAGTLSDAEPELDRLTGRGAKALGAVNDPRADLPWLAAIGYPEARAKVVARLNGHTTPPLVDPSAVVSPTAELAEGVTVFWLAGLSPLVKVGPHSFVSYGATVGHDTSVGACVSIMPGAHVSGDVTIGDQVLVGSGAVILEGRTLGESAKIGAGAVVIADVAPGETVMGVPAGPGAAITPL